ncbi:MAG: hypothetical protein JNM89_16605 [Hyphomicrobiaceae bacterium]|nr:hypothetical protein [Hyphomicrobiaceae bacterium]
MAILIGGALLAMHADGVRAQSSAPTNPWYVPPSNAAPSYAPGYGNQGRTGGFYSNGRADGYGQQQGGYASSPGYYSGNGQYTTNSLPQQGLGAGYQPQYQQPQYQPQQQYQPQYQAPPQQPAYQAPRYEPAPAQQAPRQGYAAATADRGVPGPYWSSQVEPQSYTPSYAPPPVQAAPAPVYRAQPQAYGNYPPLGGDPTVADAPRAQPESRPAARQAQAEPPRQPASPPAAYDPALAGPTTLSPYGVGVPFGTPYGGYSPFPGLPFW